jgi:hypothetical protein
MVVDAGSRNTWWGTLRRVIVLPRVNILVMLAWIIVAAVAAINVGNRYGDGWGGFIGIVIGPLVLARMMRSGLGANSGKPHRRHEGAVK